MPKKKEKIAAQREPDRESPGRARDGHIFVVQVKGAPNEVPPHMDFAQMLRDAIAKSGLSQYYISKATGIPQASLSMFLSGGDLRLATFNRLAYLMGFELRQDPKKAPKKQAR